MKKNLRQYWRLRELVVEILASTLVTYLSIVFLSFPISLINKFIFKNEYVDMKQIKIISFILFSIALCKTMIKENIEIYKENRKIKNEKCIHGVKGGSTLLLCDFCEKEENERKMILVQEQEKIEREEERKAQTRIKAKQLEEDELKRITKIQLKNKNYLLELTPSEFEEAVAIMFRGLGYSAKVTSKTNDKGKDIIMFKDGKKYLVECKHYLKATVGRPALQKFYAAIIEEKAEKGFLVTTGNIAYTVYEYVKDKNIEIINIENLIILMQKAFDNDDSNNIMKVMCTECGDIVEFSLETEEMTKRCKNGHEVIFSYNRKIISPRILSGKMYCERCGKEMKIINGYRGKFWGCKGYPNCRNTKPYKKEDKYNFESLYFQLKK